MVAAVAEAPATPTLGRATPEEAALDRAWLREHERKELALDYIRSCSHAEADELHRFAEQACSEPSAWQLLLLLPPEEITWLLDQRVAGWDRCKFKIERVQYSPDFPPGVVQ
jgi:hypothetical protein